MNLSNLHRLYHLALALGLATTAAGAADDNDPEKELSEVTVGTERETSRIEPQLRDEIIKTETFSESYIRKTNAATLTEAVDNNPGIATQMECSICNVRNVVLNNLPGRFTTVMIDGVPIFSSVSTAYGLDMIGVNGVERIDISRGAGTSLIAPEALSGVVNIVPKHPQRPEYLLQYQGGEYGYQRGDGYLAQPFDGGALTASLNVNHHNAVDHNGNLVSEYSGYRRLLGGAGLFLDDVAGFSLRGRVDVVDESRYGGWMSDDTGATKRDMTGNPYDWSRGRGGSPSVAGWLRPDGDFAAAVADGQNPVRLGGGRVLLPYDSGRGGFSEIIDTQRQQALMIGDRKVGEGKLKIAVAYAHHDQDSFYEGSYYKAGQNQGYGEISLQYPFGTTLLTAGFNYRYEDLRSRGVTAAGAEVDGIDNYTYRAPGVFFQGYHAFFDDQVEVNGSVRVDFHNVFGEIVSPRLNVLWHHTAELSSRFAVGRGFRAPTSFFEADHGILDTIAIERKITNPEISTNASYALAYAGDRDAVVLSYNWNEIENFALLDSAAQDAQGNPITIFTSATQPVTVWGFDGTYTHKFTTSLDGTVGAEGYFYDFQPGTLFFARPEQRVYLRLDYDAGDWNFFTRATWTGPMDLARFYDYENNPRYNMDGTRKREESPSYWTVDLSGRYRVHRNVSLVAGINNVFDFVQTDVEDFLWIDSVGAPDVTHLWGPARGRQVYAGLRVEF